MMQSLQQDTSFFRNGTAQFSRILKELLPEHVPIDDRKLSDMLAFSTEFAKNITHFSTQKKANWEPFFLSNITAVLAIIQAIDIKQWEEEHEKTIKELNTEWNNEKAKAAVKEIFKQIFQIPTQINQWYNYVAQINRRQQGIENEVEDAFLNIINRRLKSELHTLIAYAKGAKSLFGQEVSLQYQAFRVFGNLDSITPINIFLGQNERAQIQMALIKLRLLFRNCFNILNYVQLHFQKFLEKSLANKQDHQPNMGLFITFLLLHKHLQTDLNNLSTEHLKFYYEEILKQQKQSYQPDEVHICFELAKHIKEHTIEADTLLKAGKDKQGQNILFKTVSPLAINHTKVASLKTLFLSQYAKTQISSFRLVTGTYVAPIANSKDGVGKPFENEQDEWPICGEEQWNRPVDSHTMVKGSMGFALASPLFFLEEGNREIKLRIKFIPESLYYFRKLIEDIRSVEEKEASKRYGRFEEVTLRNAFYKIFPPGDNKNIDIWFTSKNGWEQVPSGEIKILPPEDLQADWDYIELVFRLPAHMSEVVAFDRFLYPDEKFVTRFPIIKCMLNDHIEPYIYSLWKDLEINSINIEVKVDEIKKIKIYNNIGQIDPRQPFMPFGPQPEPGSYMLIGNTEIFQKPLTELSLKMEWQNIPTTYKAFNNYYQAYDPPIKVDDFKIKLSALSEKVFHPKDENQALRYPLFDLQPSNEDDDVLLINQTKINKIILNKLNIKPDPYLQNPLYYDNQTSSGFLKLELVEPVHGFGHPLFQRLFADAVTHNADPTQEVNKDIPRQPLIPTAKSLSLSYTASTTVHIYTGTRETPEALFHIHPFGLVSTYFRGRMRGDKITLLPRYDDDAYLFIGLEDLKAPQTLSLLFQLTANKAKGHTRYNLPLIQWSYLSNDQWKQLPDEALLIDTTDNFTTTGIIQLQIPRDITTRNSMMPPQYAWLRVSIAGDTEVLCHAIDIKAQAMRAIWVGEESKSERLRAALPENSITSLLHKNPAIKGIKQPFSSFNGKPQEKIQEFFSRVSERLRHKHRAVTHWDFERLILGQFHTVMQVKCLSHLSNPQFFPKAGAITLVVVPRKNDSASPKTPKLNYKGLIAIEQYLKKWISPFVKLRIRNPAYEYIRIRCKIRFIDGHNNGQSLVRLKEDVRTFVCPWLENTQVKMNIGGAISEEVLLNFVKGLEYVKFVTSFSLLHFVKNEETGRYSYLDTATQNDTKTNKNPKQTEVAIIQARPWAVLIPDEDHHISIIQTEQEQNPTKVEGSVRFQNKVDIIQDSQLAIRIIRRKNEPDKPINNSQASKTILRIKI